MVVVVELVVVVGVLVVDAVVGVGIVVELVVVVGVLVVDAVVGVGIAQRSFKLLSS